MTDLMNDDQASVSDGLVRTAVAIVFAIHGVLLASWAPHIPFVRAKLDLTEGELGLVLLALAAGAVVAMIGSAPITARIGAHRMTGIATLAMAATMTLPVRAPGVGLLVATLALFGASLGTMDVAMNAVAVDLERRVGRPILSSLHGVFSLGVLGGSILSAVLLSFDVSPSRHTLGVAIVCAIVASGVLRKLPAVSPHSQDPGSSRIVWPRGSLLVVGLITFVVLMGEGAVLDWSATLLRDDFGASDAVSALGFGAFATTMAIGRFTGDRLNSRLGPTRLVAGGAAISAIGLFVGLLIGHPISAIVGFAIMGLGYANVVPLAFSASAAMASNPAQGISTTAALGYLGFLAGPPAIGAIAELTELRTALMGIALLTVGVALRAGAISRQEI